MSAELILETTGPSVLIIEERKRRDLVIGVPHHAPAGKPKLPCPEHLNSDENAGFLGRYLAERLECCSIIACNYPFDVNKYLRSDYTMQIAQWNPRVLMEIHGHGGGNAKSDIEISSGYPSNDQYSKQLADKLHIEFQKEESLKNLSISGDSSKIYYKATDSITITDARWIAYHIELPAVLRKPTKEVTGKPSPSGYLFCDLLASVIREIH